MKKFGVVCIICVILLIGLVSLNVKQFNPYYSENPKKIVSLAPAITETLYTLELGDKIAGVTTFCKFPPEAEDKPKVSGFREVNLEAIARTKADFVILPHDMEHHKKDIEALGISVFLFDYSSLSSFLKDTKRLAELFGKEAKARNLIDQFKQLFEQKKKNKKSVLFVILSPSDYHQLSSEMTIIGSDIFFNEIIEAAGGENVYKGNIPFPRISLEALYAMHPDIIVLCAPDFKDPESLRKIWLDSGNPKIINTRNLIIFNETSDTIPGPRSLQTIRKLSKTMEATE